MTMSRRAVGCLAVLITSHAMSGEAPAQPSDWSFLGDRLADLKGPVLPAGAWLVRGTVGHAKFKDGSSEIVAAPEFVVGLRHGFEFRLQDEFVFQSGGAESAEESSAGILLPELRWSPQQQKPGQLNLALGLGMEVVPADADILRASIYLTKEISERWLWGSNFTYQKRIGGDHELELVGKFGLHRMISPQRLSLGLEVKFEHAKTRGLEAATSREFLLGPALVWRLGDNWTLRAVEEFGLSSESPRSEGFISLEWRH